MSRVMRYILAGVGLATGFMAILHSWQFERRLERAFALTAEDLP